MIKIKQPKSSNKDKDKKTKKKQNVKPSKHDESNISSVSFEKCSSCKEDEQMNLSKSVFSCGHWFHSECYTQIKLNFDGSMCPLCFNDMRFDYLNHQLIQSSSNNELLRLDIDHSFGCISWDTFRKISTSEQVWNNVEQLSNQTFYVKLPKNELDLYAVHHDTNDHETILKKANHILALSTYEKDDKKIRNLFTNRKEISKIIELKYSISDLKRAGITIEFMLSYGYTIKDVYNLGFRTIQDLIDLKLSQNAMMMLDPTNNRPMISIQFLVDYYHLNWKDLIMIFSFYYLEYLKNSVSAYERAVYDFCKLNLRKEELIKLSLLNINNFFSIFGKHCFNADCLVEFCKGNGVNDIDVLQNVFKFDGMTFENIRGFNTNHLNILDWDHGHLFGDIIRSILNEKYNIDDHQGRPKSKRNQSHKQKHFKKVEISSSSSEEQEDEQSSESNESESSENDEDSETTNTDDDNSSSESEETIINEELDTLEELPGISFQSKRSFSSTINMPSSSSNSSSNLSSVLPKTTIESIDNHSNQSLPQKIERREVKRRDLE